MNLLPDTSINGIVLLLLAGALTGVASIALETMFNNPSSALGQGLIGVTAFVIGFGLVYGPMVFKSYLSSESATESVR